ncbi:hypothetical protein [Lacibacter luteus]|uniref:hypothetical protein n=1 Tax=Lacibacter luteus TaxID=2508719 RepID=UPI0013E91829|nr:hypothetical protein [Lacibacter luteus]
MKKEFFFRSIINSQKENSSEKISKTIITSLSIEDFRIIEFQPYWKDQTKYLFEISFFKEASSASELQCELLRVMSKMSSTWKIILDENYSLENSNFSAASEFLKLPGVDWVNIEYVV